jgi:hypothetical protein
MNKEEFLSLVWRLEEMLVHVDYLRNQIGKCPDKCESPDADNDEGLCPTCCDWFAKVLAEEERLDNDKEFNEVMRKLKDACSEDKSGMFDKILKQSREAKIVH